MSLLNRLGTRVRDVRTINALWTGAERHARGMGEERPGAEPPARWSVCGPLGSAQTPVGTFHDGHAGRALDSSACPARSARVSRTR